MLLSDIGGGTVLYLGGLENAREARAILINILIFINHERQLTARTVPYINILPQYNAKFSVFKSHKFRKSSQVKLKCFAGSNFRHSRKSYCG